MADTEGLGTLTVESADGGPPDDGDGDGSDRNLLKVIGGAVAGGTGAALLIPGGVGRR